MNKRKAVFFLSNTDEANEFIEVYSEYMGTHNADIQLIATVQGDDKDVEKFEKFFAEENGLNEVEDDNTNNVIYPNGRYM